MPVDITELFPPDEQRNPDYPFYNREKTAQFLTAHARPLTIEGMITPDTRALGMDVPTNLDRMNDLFSQAADTEFTHLTVQGLSSGIQDRIDDFQRLSPSESANRYPTPDRLREAFPRAIAHTLRLLWSGNQHGLKVVGTGLPSEFLEDLKEESIYNQFMAEQDSGIQSGRATEQFVQHILNSDFSFTDKTESVAGITTKILHDNPANKVLIAAGPGLLARSASFSKDPEDANIPDLLEKDFPGQTVIALDKSSTLATLTSGTPFATRTYMVPNVNEYTDLPPVSDWMFHIVKT